jgi:sentrin-specific protease 1
MSTREWTKAWFDEKNVDATLCWRHNCKNITRWEKKAPRNKIFNLKNIYFPINIDNHHWVCAVVYMEEKRIQYYDSLNGVGKGHKYLEGFLQYLYDSDEKKEQI